MRNKFSEGGICLVFGSFLSEGERIPEGESDLVQLDSEDTFYSKGVGKWN